MEKTTTDSNITQYLKPIFVDDDFLKTQDGLAYMIPRFIITNPLYWRDYKSHIVSIMFPSEEEQFDVLSQIVRSINKAHAPTKELLDSIPRRLIPLSMLNVMAKKLLGLIPEEMLAGIGEYNKKGVDYVICIYSSPHNGKDEKTYAITIPLYYEVAAAAMVKTNPDLVSYYKFHEPLDPNFDPLAAEYAPMRDKMRQYISRKTCTQCKKEECTKRCVCGMYYCDKDCQLLDWKKAHKDLCNTWRIYMLSLTNMLANTDVKNTTSSANRF